MSRKAAAQEKTYYDILEIPKTSSQTDIKKAYQRLSRIHHPDRGGDVAKSQEINEAYEVLKDEEKRQLYDRFGKEGVSGDDGPSDPFEALFGMRRGGQGRQREQQSEPIAQALKVTLNDLYNGKTCRVPVARNKRCGTCEGRGGKEGSQHACAHCNGRGVRIQIIQMGPMIQQVQSACRPCEGQGMVIAEKDKCKACSGNKICKETKEFSVPIDKGMKHNQKIKFASEGDDVPGFMAGDVIFVVQEVEHDKFKRKGADLLYSMQITLAESLCGFDKVITHMDGRILKLSSPAGTVLKNEACKVIEGEGMPHYGNPFTKGRLFVQFTVLFPNTLPQATVAAIRPLLPSPAPLSLSGEEEECVLSDADLRQVGQDTGSSAGYRDEDDDDEEGGGQQVPCRSM